MVKRTFCIVLLAFFLSLTSTAFLLAGEFIANVSSAHVHLNDSFTLNLTLKDTSPKEAPDVTELKNDFLIHGQQHYTNSTFINGKSSSSITWKLILSPKTEGVLQIPPITVNTTEGILTTQPITLNATKGATPQSTIDSNKPSLITKISNASPYKNEPFIYSALLTSKTQLYNVQTQKIQMEDAIVELVEEPKLEDRVIDGIVLKVVEFSYLITPLKPGPLTIPPLSIQGAVPQKKQGPFSSFFQDDLSSFAIMQGFDRVTPFTLMTEEIKINVEPPVPEVTPWLSAKDITIEELWPSDQTLRVGEPFSRSFMIKAEGLKASQLPYLEDLQSLGSTFKVYADKPEEQEKVLPSTIESMRKEHYTLIPQQAGKWVLPEIAVSWWDSAKKERRTSTIPARTIEIQAAVSIEATQTYQTAQTTAPLPEVLVSTHPPFLLYSIIAGLIFSLAAALLWGFTLRRKIASLTQDLLPKPVKSQPAKQQKPIEPSVTTPQRTKKEKLPDLNPT